MQAWKVLMLKNVVRIVTAVSDIVTLEIYCAERERRQSQKWSLFNFLLTQQSTALKSFWHRITNFWKCYYDKCLKKIIELAGFEVQSIEQTWFGGGMKWRTGRSILLSSQTKVYRAATILHSVLFLLCSDFSAAVFDISRSIVWSISLLRSWWSYQ